MSTRFTRREIKDLPNYELISLWQSFKHSRQYQTGRQSEDFLSMIDRERILDELCVRVTLLEGWLKEDNRALTMSSAHELGEGSIGPDS